MKIVDHLGVLSALRSGAQIVDVLPGHEYRSAHIRGALHLPLPRLFSGADEVLAKDRPVIVYCRDAL